MAENLEYKSQHSGPQIDEAVSAFINRGKANGVAMLDETGKVPVSQIPDEEYSAVTMLASGWDGNKYSFEAEYPHEQYNIEVSVADTATVEQFEAAGAALIGSSATSNVFTARGEIPTVDIPVVVKAVKK